MSNFNEFRTETAFVKESSSNMEETPESGLSARDTWSNNFSNAIVRDPKLTETTGRLAPIDGEGSFSLTDDSKMTSLQNENGESIIAAPQGVLEADRIAAGKTVIFDAERRAWFKVERQVLEGRATYYAVGDSTGTGSRTSNGETFKDWGQTTFATWNAPGIPNKSGDKILLAVNQSGSTAKYAGREINAAIGRRNDSGPHPSTGAIIDFNSEARAQVFPNQGETQVVVFELKPIPKEQVPAGANRQVGVYYNGFPATSGDPKARTDNQS